MNRAATEEMDNGFFHHGVATPVSNHRGTVATVDGEGRDVALVWLFDHRGGYSLLLIDAETGESEEFPVPFPPGGDCPYASILSSRNRFYTHFNSYFVEFDPGQRRFTFCPETAPQMALGMTEDDRGRIWSVTYPDSGVVVYDPEKEEFRDYGHVYLQNWRQYQRYVAADAAGWIYFGVGSTASQIVAFDPESGQGKPMLAEEERGRGSAFVYRDENGKVYGQALEGTEEGWYEFYAGEGKEVGRLEERRPKRIITSSQSLFHAEFPTGRTLKLCDLFERRMEVEEVDGKVRRLSFDYGSEGAHVMGLAAAPDGTICGGTAFPMRFFAYDPRADEWVNRASYGQWNTVVRQGERFFVGGYTGGFLLEWDPARPWAATDKENRGGNPRLLTECAPAINRPHCLLAHPDGKRLVLAGTPGYGYTGGGLLFWDREKEEATLVEHGEILPDHSTMSLVALPGEKLLGGTTTSPGTGGEKKAELAELYAMDMGTKEVEWHAPVLPGAQEYTDMMGGDDGLVYGVADRGLFFVFDADRREVVHAEQVAERLGKTGYHQGPRLFVRGGDGAIYLLFERGIGRIDAESFAVELLAESPVPVQAGGDWLDGRIYFASGSHLYSYRVPQ